MTSPAQTVRTPVIALRLYTEHTVSVTHKPRAHCECTAATLRMHRGHTANAPRPHCECTAATANAPRPHCECTAATLRMHRGHTANAPRPHCECTAATLRMHRGHTANAPRPHCECTAATLRMHRGHSDEGQGSHTRRAQGKQADGLGAERRPGTTGITRAEENPRTAGRRRRPRARNRNPKHRRGSKGRPYFTGQPRVSALRAPRCLREAGRTFRAGGGRGRERGEGGGGGRGLQGELPL